MTDNLSSILSTEPAYRLKQIERAKFDPKIKNYADISALPLELRKKLKGLPWLAVKQKLIKKSELDGTEKALLELADGLCVETVLMARGDEEKIRRTICLSSQVGCGMACIFCATGRMGFARNLTTEEIIDQYRFWQNHLAKNGNEAIGNIVIMGQGEPLLNYDEIKKAINIILQNTDVGPSKVTLSTVGEKIMMEKILQDKEFPPVRLAISLHSAIEKTRKQIVPSTQSEFLDFLIEWSEKYHKMLGSRSHFLSLEYVLLRGINDDEAHLRALINLARKLGRVKINLIPLNPAGTNIAGSPPETIKKWHDALMNAGFTCTIRRSQGADIAAACGQLQNLEIRK